MNFFNHIMPCVVIIGRYDLFRVDEDRRGTTHHERDKDGVVREAFFGRLVRSYEGHSHTYNDRPYRYRLKKDQLEV